jgi:hypothetical protein
MPGWRPILSVPPAADVAARRKHRRTVMQWITVATPPFGSIEQFDKVHAQHGEPAGLEARYVGRADDGTLRIVTLWESKAHAERFFAETLGPALAKTLGPEPVGAPEAVGIDVARSYSREPVA